jgi:hypothetical protein
VFNSLHGATDPSSLHRSNLRLKQPSIQWVQRALSLEVKRTGREGDHSSPSSAELTNGEVIAPPPIRLLCLMLN